MIYAVWFENEQNNDAVGKTCEDRGVGAKDSKAQHDTAWKLFEYALKKEYDIELSECTILRNRWGQPRLKEYPGIYFSISHCKSIAVCVLADDEVGIDAEAVGRVCKENVWRRMLSEGEYVRLLSMEDDKRDKEFLKYWTLKECYGKAIGTGLSYDYKKVIFAIEDVGITSNLPEHKLWQTVINKNNKEFIVSVCRKQTGAFEESIEWVSLTGGETYEA